MCVLRIENIHERKRPYKNISQYFLLCKHKSLIFFILIHITEAEDDMEVEKVHIPSEVFGSLKPAEEEAE